MQFICIQTTFLEKRDNDSLRKVVSLDFEIVKYNPCIMHIIVLKSQQKLLAKSQGEGKFGAFENDSQQALHNSQYV